MKYEINRNKFWAVASTVLGLALMMPGMAAAQGPGPQGGGDDHHGMGERLGQELNLTADQKAKMQQIHEQTREQMKAIHDDQSLTQEQRMQKIQALHQTTKTQMEAILTPEQKEKFAEIRKNHEGGEGHQRGGPGEGLGQELNLSADQKTKVQSIFESTHEQMRAIEDDPSLSQQDKQAKIKALHETTKSQINALLTPEQQQKFAQMHKNHEGPGGHHGHHGPPPQGSDSSSNP